MTSRGSAWGLRGWGAGVGGEEGVMLVGEGVVIVVTLLERSGTLDEALLAGVASAA